MIKLIITLYGSLFFQGKCISGNNDDVVANLPAGKAGLALPQ